MPGAGGIGCRVFLNSEACGCSLFSLREVLSSFALALLGYCKTLLCWLITLLRPQAQ